MSSIMTNTHITFEQKLATLKANYALQLPNKLAEIHRGWRELNEHMAEEPLTLLHRNVHSLIGTSGTLGFTELSKAARALETTLKPWCDGLADNSFNLDNTNNLNNLTLKNAIQEKLDTLTALVNATQIKTS
jgi:chemotaxis protein histidine kinase CheA